jgi:hypothetical protein
MNFGDLLGQLREFDVLPASGLAIEYRLAIELRDHPDVLTIKLLSGKITCIHRPLWPAVFAIGTARQPWQMLGLSKDAAALLQQSDQEGKAQLEAAVDRLNAHFGARGTLPWQAGTKRR